MSQEFYIEITKLQCVKIRKWSYLIFRTYKTECCIKIWQTLCGLYWSALRHRWRDECNDLFICFLWRNYRLWQKIAQNKNCLFYEDLNSLFLIILESKLTLNYLGFKIYSKKYSFIDESISSTVFSLISWINSRRWWSKEWKCQECSLHPKNIKKFYRTFKVKNKITIFLYVFYVYSGRNVLQSFKWFLICTSKLWVWSWWKIV